MKRLQIAVIGSAGLEEYDYEKPDILMFDRAYDLGKKLGQQEYIVINGGKGGVMEAVSKGVSESGTGIVVAETSGNERFSANKYVDVEVVTCDIGFRGPSQLIGMSDIIISLGGGAGTLQELCVAYRMQKPLIMFQGYGGWTDNLKGSKYLDERRLVPFTFVKSVSGALEQVANFATIIRKETNE